MRLWQTRYAFFLILALVPIQKNPNIANLSYLSLQYAISVYVSDVGNDIFLELSYWTSVLSDRDAEIVGHALLRALDVLFMAKSTDHPLSLVI